MVVDDRSKMQITAAGMDYLQENLPNPQTILPFLKLKQEEPEENLIAPDMPFAEPESTQPAESVSPRYLNLVPLLGLANLAASVAHESPSVEIGPKETATEAAMEATEIPERAAVSEVPTAAAASPQAGSPGNVTIESGRPRLMNIVRRSLTLP
jgi:hypothetical protein